MDAHQIKEWLENGRDWELGKKIYLAIGTEKRFRLRIQKARETPLLRNLLYTKLRQILRKERIALPKPDNPIVEVLPLVIKPKEPEVIITDRIEELEKTNSRLYNQRAMLSNQLSDPQNDEMIRLENCRLVDRITSIHKEMLDNRNLIRRLSKGEAEEIMPEEKGHGGKIVVQMRQIGYTKEDLKGLSLEEIVTLRERVRQQESKSRTKLKRADTPEDKKYYQQLQKRKFKELQLLTKIRDGKK